MSSSGYSSDDSSDRPDDSQAQHSFCPHQTNRYNGNECSRYRDCPGHTVERPADSDVEDEDEDDAEDSQNSDIDEEEEEQLEGSPDPRVLSLDSGNPDSLQRAAEASENADGPRPDHEVIDLTTPSPPHRRSGGSAVAGPSQAPGHGDEEEHTIGRSPAVEVVDLTEDSPEESATSGSRTVAGGPNEERALPTIPGSSRNSSNPSLSRAGAALPSAQRRPTTPPSPPPPIRRRTSANNFGTAPRPDAMQAPRPSASRRPSELVLPRWQPDAEVTICPICHTQFSFLIRKHHCRKCGRVVCNRCSPHRITIPYQYIVQPPGTPRPGAQRYPASLISGEGGHADFSSLGGGEKVRLCNPCVPDPNTNPPDSQGSPSSVRSHGRSQSNVGPMGGYGSNAAGPSQPGPHFDAYVRNRSATMMPSGSRPAPGGRFYHPTQSRILSGTPPSGYPPTHGGSPFGSYRTHRHRSAYDVGGQSASSSSAAAAATAAAAAAAAHRRPLPPDPPQLAEEDECPICHRELPSQSLANSAELREAHINSCITSHSTYGGGTSPAGESSRPRRTGMFPYVATEKDCVDSAECTICLEEFEVGVPMARLECLCRFHRDCISRWFAKNPGRCPVHSHDGHGF